MSVDESVYIGHVAELGESREVVVTEDIHAENGVKLLARGATVNRRVLDRLLRHKLVKPIDHTTRVSDSVDHSVLVASATELMARDTETGAMLRCLRDQHFPRRVFRRVHLVPVINNKLSVARCLYPSLFEHSIRVTLAAMVIGEQMGWAESELEVLATAALTHDIGALHIEATQLDQKQQLQAEHWRQIYAHSRIGYLILDQFPQYRPAVSRAVLEHHERIDGSGYPSGRRGAGISPAGRVLGFADFAAATAQKMGIRHMFTVTKSQPRAFEREVVRVLAGLLQQCAEVMLPAESRMDASTLHELIRSVAEILDAAPPKAPASDAPAQVARNVELLRGVIAQLRLMIHRTGFRIQDHEGCMKMLEGDPELQAELESLIQEAYFQLRVLVLELHRRSHSGSEQIIECRHLGSWLEAAETVLAGMRDRLPAQP